MAYGLREYWIVDPETKCVTVLNRQGEAWVEQVYRDDQQARSLVLPGFVVSVMNLWIDVEDDQPDAETANGDS